ncbi:hypothetical protein [Streptomyces sp. JB150]|uniref:hypothetical protein n=1 Tax=Streptomyces sp. JB150 TaxID=2714844 RepID=UPI0014092E30|nr:hypothetical protein [Streptomyces sp. JB150]QIJ65565.1 hypothetical protein G7Z13_28695 [Streptomyces sp. JB150]
MISRRSLLGAVAGAGALTLVQHTLTPAPAVAAPDAAGGTEPDTIRWTGKKSANGWPIDPGAIAAFRVEGSGVPVRLREGDAAAVLLHVARRWHYEIAPLDSGEGGGVTAHTTRRDLGADFESNHLSGTAVALHPTAYPLAGSEGLWPHQEAIVRDILADCEGTVVWGGDLTPVKVSHFHLAARPGDRTLARVAARLDTGRPTTAPRAQTAGTVADPAAPARRLKARRLERAQTS